jgi:hypothetical protein
MTRPEKKAEQYRNANVNPYTDKDVFVVRDPNTTYNALVRAHDRAVLAVQQSNVNGLVEWARKNDYMLQGSLEANVPIVNQTQFDCYQAGVGVTRQAHAQRMHELQANDPGPQPVDHPQARIIKDPNAADNPLHVLVDKGDVIGMSRDPVELAVLAAKDGYGIAIQMGDRAPMNAAEAIDWNAAAEAFSGARLQERYDALRYTAQSEVDQALATPEMDRRLINMQADMIADAEGFGEDPPDATATADLGPKPDAGPSGEILSSEELTSRIQAERDASAAQSIESLANLPSDDPRAALGTTAASRSFPDAHRAAAETGARAQIPGVKHHKSKARASAKVLKRNKP